MNKKKYIITSLILAALMGVDVSAQTNSAIYVEAGAGAQILFSKNATELNFGQRITPSLSLGVGKWFFPYLGAKVEFQGFSLNGYSDGRGLFKTADGQWGLFQDASLNQYFLRPDGGHRRNLRYLNSMISIQTSICNLIAGYCPERKWDIIPSVGVGVMHLFDYKGVTKTNTVPLNLALQGKWHFNPNFDLNMTVASSRFPDKFDARVTDYKAAWNLGVTLGANYYFCVTPFKKRVRAPKPVVVSDSNASQRIYVESTAMPAVQVEKVEVEKPVYNHPFVLASILFKIGKSEIDSNEGIQLQNVADYLKNNSNAVARLDGYSDKDTGSSQGNMDLSLKRAVAVQNQLAEQYGVDRKRLQIVPMGDTQQPYAATDWNRSVVVTILELAPTH